jgi:hypothetical protein
VIQSGGFGESKISFRITPTSNLTNATYILNTFKKSVDKVGAISIATRYELDSPGIEFRLMQAFTHPSGRALEPNQPPRQWIPVPFSGGKAAAIWC